MKDIGFLRSSANFNVKISHDLFWVPVNSLGNGRYSCDEILKILLLNPAERKKHFGNLYEVVQSFILSDFKYVMDTEYIELGGEVWEIHKKAEEVVIKNYGCCSSVASWLKYYLDDIYDENGYFSFIRPNGSGHVMNYIKTNGWYYVIDLTPYVIDEKYKLIYESGNKVDYVKSKNVTGVLMKCKDLVSYALYYERIQAVGGFHFIYFKSVDKDVNSILIRQTNGKIRVVYPEHSKIECIYNGNPDFYSVEFAKFNNN